MIARPSSVILDNPFTSRQYHRHLMGITYLSKHQDRYLYSTARKDSLSMFHIGKQEELSTRKKRNCLYKCLVWTGIKIQKLAGPQLLSDITINLMTKNKAFYTNDLVTSSLRFWKTSLAY